MSSAHGPPFLPCQLHSLWVLLPPFPPVGVKLLPSQTCELKLGKRASSAALAGSFHAVSIKSNATCKLQRKTLVAKCQLVHLLSIKDSVLAACRGKKSLGSRLSLQARETKITKGISGMQGREMLTVRLSSKDANFDLAKHSEKQLLALLQAHLLFFRSPNHPRASDLRIHFLRYQNTIQARENCQQQSPQKDSEDAAASRADVPTRTRGMPAPSQLGFVLSF